MELRILFIEDMPDDAELMLRRLHEAGIEPHWARVDTAAALREALAAEQWQVALVDFNLPSFSGPEAIALLAELAPDLPAITVSGAISEETAVATITAGAVDYVLKDNLTRLAPAVLRAVEGAELRHKERRAAAQAAESDARYRHIVDTALEGVWAIDGEYRTTFVNSQMAAMLGYEVEEMLGRAMSEFVFKEDLADHAVQLRDRVEGLPGHYEHRFRCKDGGEVWAQVSLTAYLGPDGGSLGSFGMFTDITERKRIEDALRASETHFRAFFQQAGVGMASSSLEKAWLEANDTLCEMLGYSREELAHMTWADLTYPDDLAADVAHFDRVVSGEIDEYDIDKRFVHKSGRLVHVHLSVHGVRRGDGSLDYIAAILEDITKRKQAEDEKVEQTRLNRIILDSLPCVALLLRPKTREIVAMNRAAEEAGCRLGATCFETWPKFEKPCPWCLAPELWAEGRAQRLEVEALGVVWDAHWMPVSDDIYLHYAFDVTEQVETQIEIRRQAEQLRRTVEGAVLAMSHVVETRDPYTAGHERRVAELATAIAAEMGMEGEELTALRHAGLIHDIGKVAVPAEILSKPGRLSAVEFDLIKQHPATGFDILEAIDFGRPVAEMVLQHHERLDGSGYPRGLAGEEVMREARILAVADVVEAMSSHRPYRAALGMEAALAEIRAHAGVTYDAEVAAACVRLFEERGFQFTE